MGGGNSLKNNNLNSYTQDLDDLGVAEIEEIIETPENNEYLASLGLSSKLTEPYPYDVTTILAYKKTGNNYVFDKVAYVKNDGKFNLSAGQNYTLLLHGGRVEENNIYNKQDINNVYIENKNLNFKPLFQRIDNFTPNGYKKTNVLPVKMKYPGSHVTLVFDSTDLLGGNTGKKITLISSAGHNNADAALRGYRHRLTQTQGISFLTGNGVITKERALEFKGESKLSVPIVLGNTLRKNLNITLSLKTEDSHEKRTIKIPLRNLKKSYKQTYKFKLRRCGVYLERNKNWKQFMCHNLGADYNLDPFTPSANIHGDKYQWGYSYPIVKQKDDVYKTGIVPGWNRVWKYNTWNRGIDDPCPTGYRIPTESEWWNVIHNNNTRKVIGNWRDSPTARYDSGGMMFGDHLMLPTAGVRTQTGSTKDARGAGIAIWLANQHTNFFIKSSDLGSIVAYPSAAIPIRCIKK